MISVCIFAAAAEQTGDRIEQIRTRKVRMRGEEQRGRQRAITDRAKQNGHFYSLSLQREHRVP